MAKIKNDAFEPPKMKYKLPQFDWFKFNERNRNTDTISLGKKFYIEYGKISQLMVNLENKDLPILDILQLKLKYLQMYKLEFQKVYPRNIIYCDINDFACLCDLDIEKIENN